MYFLSVNQLKPDASPREIGRVVSDHIAWSRALIEKGTLVQAGRWGEGRGMAIIKAGDLAEAEAVQAQDPLVSSASRRTTSLACFRTFPSSDGTAAPALREHRPIGSGRASGPAATTGHLARASLHERRAVAAPPRVRYSARLMRIALLLALIHGLVPGLGELAEAAVHHVVGGHLAPSCAERGEPGDAGHPQGCCGTVEHHCGCCAPQVFVAQPSGAPPGALPSTQCAPVERGQLVSLHDPAPPRRPPIAS